VGGPSGLAVDDQLLLKLADMKSDGLILPPPTMTVETRVLDGQELAVVTVLASDAPPVRCRGTIFVRIGPRRGIATAQDERVLNERRRSSDRPFDVQPLPSATIADLDVRFFEEQYLSAAFSREVLAQNERTITQRLAATKMIVGDLETTPTVLAACGESASTARVSRRAKIKEPQRSSIRSDTGELRRRRDSPSCSPAARMTFATGC